MKVKLQNDEILVPPNHLAAFVRGIAVTQG